MEYPDANADAGLATALTAFSLGKNVYLVLTDNNAANGTTVENIQISDWLIFKNCEVWTNRHQTSNSRFPFALVNNCTEGYLPEPIFLSETYNDTKSAHSPL